MNVREAAFCALLRAQTEGIFLNDSLLEWKLVSHPSEKDFRLGQEIAYGTMRMKKALDFLSRQLAHRGLNVKKSEKTILSMAMYQYFYMDKIPIYAVVNESVALAKKHCHIRSIPFINALLRKLETTDLSLPQGDTLENLSIRYSYPEEYVSLLMEEYGMEAAKNLLHCGNLPPVLMGRLRGSGNGNFSYIIREPMPIVTLDTLPNASDTNIYVQNVTPAFLIGTCSRWLENKPKRILDMCASPGGKAIAIHDLFPEAFLHVNDVSAEKMAILKENLKRYEIEAFCTVSPGQKINAQEIKAEDAYDLIVIDAPCSNTGVFNKRPEARWRFSPESLSALRNTQKALIAHAKTLLSPKGQIWYLTCSIIKEENEDLVKEMAPIFQKTILPNQEGWDGGFCAIIRQ